MASDLKYQSFNLYFEDESRFGLFTKNGRVLTAKGVKPVCPFHQVFKSTYLFGAFSPLDGDSLLMEFPNCNGESFQIYLNEFSSHLPDTFKIIVLDNGAFHKAKNLKIPENIALIFLPPYSPELNPAENMWAKMKRGFTGKLFHTLDDLSVFIQQSANKLSESQIKKTCRFPYISANIDWTM